VARPKHASRAPGSTGGGLTAKQRAVDLAGLTLAEGEPVWLHAFPLGEYDHPVHGRLVFTRERLQRFAENLRRRIRGIDLAIDYEHGQDLAKGKRAAGWITGAEVRADGLWILARFTDEGRREIIAGHWRYLSPDYQDEWTDARGQRWQDVLFGAALTNRPFLKELAPIAGLAPLPYGRRWNQAIEAAAPSRSRSAAPPMNSDVSSRFSST